MNNKIIIFSGKQLSGKDTVAKLLLELLTDFKRIGLGDAIKLEYGEQKGLSFGDIEANKALYRPDLIELGNLRRAQDKDYWIKKVVALKENIIVPDVRMKRELEYFKAQNAFTIRVEATLETRQKRGVLASINDATETELDSVLDWDYVIDNNGSEGDLNKEVHKLHEYLMSYYL